ncbi:hypothetical protein HNO88_001725 [Novosphingobium chloroacetimidivorans]|uniref:Uncharacterized protein n=1 Tax=Novosphingobium chloroacetimidivorans TaxID=1428314 RepID=A0A7W7K9H1_9SPHN|nr:hypothetical protein [Novosphingobium chloroacetimidivorans]
MAVRPIAHGRTRAIPADSATEAAACAAMRHPSFKYNRVSREVRIRHAPLSWR